MDDIIKMLGGMIADQVPKDDGDKKGKDKTEAVNTAVELAGMFGGGGGGAAAGGAGAAAGAAGMGGMMAALGPIGIGLMAAQQLKGAVNNAATQATGMAVGTAQGAANVSLAAADPNSGISGMLTPATEGLREYGGVVGELAAGGLELVTVIEQWGEALVDSQLKLAKYSGQMGLAAAEKNFGDMRRNIKQANATGGSTRELIAAQSRFYDEIQPLKTAVINISSGLLTVVYKIGKNMAEVARLVDPILKALDITGDPEAAAPPHVNKFLDDLAKGVPKGPWRDKKR